MGLELLEILREHADQLLGRLGEGGLILPGLDRVEDMRLDAGHRCGNGETEIRVPAEVGAVERAVERRRQQATRHADRHAPPGAVAAAGPAGVHQPAIDMVLGDEVAQQVGVFRRVARQEGRAEAGRELRLHADQAALGAGDLGGIAGEEVVHRLGRGQLGDRRHHAEGVGRQHYDVLRRAGPAGARSVRNGVERIGRARVLGLALVVEIDLARDRVHHDVLEHRAEALRGREDLRLGLGREADRLGVAAALEIEDAVLRPAVLVIADQGAVGIGGEGGLAGAGEAEEDRRVVLGADIGRAVHGNHALRRQGVVQIGEDRFLHLAGIGGAADQHDLAREVDRDDGLAAAAMAGRIGLEARQVDDRQFRHITRDLAGLRPDQQVTDEEGVPGHLGEDPSLDAMSRIGAAIEILREKLLALGVLDEVAEQGLELLRRDRAVVLPPDALLGQCVLDDELVLGRAAGMAAGIGAERTAAG